MPSFLFHFRMKTLFNILFLSLGFGAIAQDTLPDFSVRNRGNNRIVVSWYNDFKTVRQISIQRSADSLTNYKTILTVPDPNNRQNGFMDTKAPQDNMFYRLYILLDGSNFLVTRPQRPFDETLIQKVLQKSLTDSVLSDEELMIVKRFGDSKKNISKDTMAAVEISAVLKDKNATKVVMPTYRIATNRDGNIRINLKDFDNKRYSIKFYEEDETFLFELNKIGSALLILDKSNFHHSGWFIYELFDDGILVEKHRFLIPKDF